VRCGTHVARGAKEGCFHFKPPFPDRVRRPASAGGQPALGPKLGKTIRIVETRGWRIHGRYFSARRPNGKRLEALRHRPRVVSEADPFDLSARDRRRPAGDPTAKGAMRRHKSFRPLRSKTDGFDLGVVMRLLSHGNGRPSTLRIRNVTHPQCLLKTYGRVVAGPCPIELAEERNVNGRLDQSSTSISVIVGSGEA
jgi:hypothetical protein